MRADEVGLHTGRESPREPVQRFCGDLGVWPLTNHYPAGGETRAYRWLNDASGRLCCSCCCAMQQAQGERARSQRWVTSITTVSTMIRGGSLMAIGGSLPSRAPLFGGTGHSHHQHHALDARTLCFPGRHGHRTSSHTRESNR